MRYRNQIYIVVAICLTLLIVTVILISQVFLKIESYETQVSDNVQYSTSRLQVEHLKLLRALEQVRDEEDIANVRSKFDVFYSRANSIAKGETFTEAFNGTETSWQLNLVLKTLNEHLEIIDSADSSVLQNVELLRDDLSALEPAIRRITLESLIIEARNSTQKRHDLSNKLIEFSVLSALFILAMLGLLYLLRNNYQAFRIRAEQNRVTSQRLRTILDTSLDPIVVVDHKGRFIDHNKAFELTFTSDNRQIKNLLFSDILQYDASGPSGSKLTTFELFNLCLTGPRRMDKLLATKNDGTSFPAELSADIASHKGDRVCVCYIRDVSEQLAAQREMSRSRDLALANDRAKDRFLAVMSHEMKTPLQGIFGALDLLGQTSLSENQTRYANLIEGSSRLLRNQISDALTLLADETQAPLETSETTFNVETLLDDIIFSQNIEAERKGIQLQRLKNGPPVGKVFGDPDRLHQVLLNLVSNAIKFTTKGSVTIETARFSSNKSDIVEFQITDTGIGIDPVDIPKIFEDYVRLTDASTDHTDGSGLGLGIAKQLTVRLGGNIGAESIKGEGSVFWVRVPLPRAYPPDCTEGSTSGSTQKAQNILLVEDTAASRIVLAELLKSEGHNVTQASNGYEAVRLASLASFDLIVMDYNMPGIDGVETLHRIQKLNIQATHMRVVFLTAHLNPKERKILESSEIDAIFEKPIHLQNLRNLTCPGLDLPQVETDKSQTLNRDILKQLSATIKREKLEIWLEDFIREGDTFVSTLSSQQPRDTLQEDVHRFSGSCATFGAFLMQTRLIEIETYLSDDCQVITSESISELRETWLKTRNALIQHKK